MRILILGGAGMLGHKLWQIFREQFDTYVTVHRDYSTYAKYHIFDEERMRTGVDVFNFSSFVQVFAELQPDVVVNCIGVIKQLPLAQKPIIALEVNSLLPHRLSELCQITGARLIHISTDCVFSGNKGLYKESDVPDPVDLYDRSKLLGEVTANGCLTIRTSMLGRGLTKRVSLLDWFLSQQGREIKGYTNVIFSGLTTLALSRILVEICRDYRDMSGLSHISSDPISKYNLLLRLREKFGMSVEINPVQVTPCDRSLDSSRFWSATRLSRPSWDDMIDELVKDNTRYEQPIS